MSKTTHHNYVDNSGRVYCFRLDQSVSLDKTPCSDCPYFTDSANMMGVSCTFDDGCNLSSVTFENPADSERHSKMVLARLGLKTEEEVKRSLKEMSEEGSDVT